MDPTGQALLKLLFNEGESVCVSNNEFGFHSIPLESALSGDIDLISPNDKSPLNPCTSSDLILAAMNPIKGWRRDENCTALRTFLVELDSGTMPEQLATIEHLKMPWSAQVFSGNKSIHTAIILDEDLPNITVYRYLVEWIFRIVPLVDKKCRNPSRSIRIPGAYREEGKKQRLYRIGNRIPFKTLMDWLNQYKHLEPVAREKKVVEIGEPDYDKLSGWARYCLTNGIQFKNGRNQTWFGLAVDFALAGFTEEMTIDILSTKFQEEYDFKEREWLITIASAFKHVEDGKVDSGHLIE